MLISFVQRVVNVFHLVCIHVKSRHYQVLLVTTNPFVLDLSDDDDNGFMDRDQFEGTGVMMTRELIPKDSTRGVRLEQRGAGWLRQTL